MKDKLSSVACLICGLSVLLGAMMAHGLKNIWSEYQLQIFQTGVYYQMLHALAALALLAYVCDENQKKIVRAVKFWFVGICLFSGSLYLIAATGIKKIGIITPLGGIIFIVGWMLAAQALWGKLGRSKII